MLLTTYYYFLFYDVAKTRDSLLKLDSASPYRITCNTKKAFISEYEGLKMLGLKRCEPAGARTQDPRLKRALLYQLSYRFIIFDILGRFPVIALQR